MKMNFRLVMLMALACIISSCRGSDGNGTATVSTAEIVGNWELTGVSIDGSIFPYNGKSAANEAGYTNSFEKNQYIITEKELTVISSDELGMTMKVSQSYNLEGRKIVTVKEPDFAVNGFEILVVSASSMTIRPEVSEPAHLQLVLTRIADADVASNQSTAIGQSLNYNFKSEKLNLTENILAPFRKELVEGKNQTISCRYSKLSGEKILRINSSTSILSDKTITTDTTHLMLDSNLKFDFNHLEEELASNMDLKNDLILGNINGSNGDKYYLAPGAACALKIKRSKRNINLSGECLNVQARAANNGIEKGTLKFALNCALEF